MYLCVCVGLCGCVWPVGDRRVARRGGAEAETGEPKERRNLSLSLTRREIKTRERDRASAALVRQLGQAGEAWPPVDLLLGLLTRDPRHPPCLRRWWQLGWRSTSRQIELETLRRWSSPWSSRFLVLLQWLRSRLGQSAGSDSGAGDRLAHMAESFKQVVAAAAIKREKIRGEEAAARSPCATVKQVLWNGTSEIGAAGGEQRGAAEESEEEGGGGGGATKRDSSRGRDEEERKRNEMR